MTTHNLTEKENDYLELIINSDYHDGEAVVGNHVWSEATTASQKGCVASLQKKGFLDVSEPDAGRGNATTHAITQEGFEAHTDFVQAKNDDIVGQALTADHVVCEPEPAFEEPKTEKEIENEQKAEIINALPLEKLEEIVSGLVGAEIKFSRSMRTDNWGGVRYDLESNDFADKVSTPKGLFESIKVITWSGMWVDLEKNAVFMDLHYSYGHFDGGGNGHGFAKVAWYKDTNSWGF